jgi:diguanylate cyclase (GGDEF)-like protein
MTGSMSIHTDISERKRAEQQLIYNALHDTLTDLPNRALFLEHLRRAMARSPLHKKSFAVLFLDFDGFKLINDSLGHAEGDNLLKMIARRLESLLRGDDIVARLGGDEFTILLNELTLPEDVLTVVERINRLFSEPFRIGGRDVFISASVGIAMRDQKYECPEEMLRDADIAMYRAKSAGKARHEIFNQDMREQVNQRLRIETELRMALERKQFAVFYQPIMHLTNNRIIGFEALIRWLHPERGLVFPNDFIPVAEDTGIIIQIGEWVLEESCRQIREWQTRFPDQADLTISVNLSCKQFIQHDLARRVAAILRDTQLTPHHLRLEVTESHLMENSEMAITIMNDLRELGVQLSIDDFGTGYSSLSYLQRLPINYLKIDRSFINVMNANHENGEIVKAIVMLAKNLQMEVIAEGIETEDQAARLVNLDCTLGQGYLFSKPTDAAQAEAILRDTPAFTPPAEDYEMMIGAVQLI